MSAPKRDHFSPKPKDLRLPISRVKTIMKSSPDVEAVGPEPLYLVTKATEMFVVDLAKRAFKNSNGNMLLDYKHVADIVQEDDTLDFLREIIPRKITVKQYKELMAKRAARGGNSDDDSSESSSDSSDETSSSNEENKAE